jgi:hypothetical protein
VSEIHFIEGKPKISASLKFPAQDIGGKFGACLRPLGLTDFCEGSGSESIRRKSIFIRVTTQIPMQDPPATSTPTLCGIVSFIFILKDRGWGFKLQTIARKFFC